MSELNFVEWSEDLKDSFVEDTLKTGYGGIFHSFVKFYLIYLFSSTAILSMGSYFG